MAKENKKFIYGLIREGAGAKDYETAIMWLAYCEKFHPAMAVRTAITDYKKEERLVNLQLYSILQIKGLHAD